MEALQGLIVKGIGGFYYVRDDGGTVYELRAKGKLRHHRVSPMVGDRVTFIPGEGDVDGWVESILPRESELIRPPVANIRHILIVIAPRPQPDLMLVDTLLIMARRQHIRPVIVVNKCDLDDGVLYEQAQAEYARSDCPVVRVSAAEGTGLDQLDAVLRDGICCFAGQSGVGKSTLLSRITGFTLDTGEISRKISRGKHTTRHAELMFSGAYCVLDTPGFSLLDLSELPQNEEPITLKESYPEFEPYEGLCRFQPCYHLREPGCAVLKAQADGELNPARLDRYHKLLEKAQEDWRNRYD